MSEELDIIPAEEGGGEARKLGCLPVEPSNLLMTGRRVKDRVDLLTERKARDILESKDRLPARERFGDRFILDQNGQGACNYFMAAGMLMRLLFMTGRGFVPLWASAAYAREVNGVDRGSSLKASFRDLQEKGMPPMSARGNAPEFVIRRSQVPGQAWTEGERFKAFELDWVENEQELFSGIALGGIACVAITAGSGYGQLDADGISKGGGGRGNHAVGLDDAIYNTRRSIWTYDNFNSWKLSFGQRGRTILTWKRHLESPLPYHGIYIAWAALDDPEADNPPEA